ncbi:hypothetical protein FNF29_08455 [Cafeteria roenbergensis]|uniref:EGF-like domain-containing protein n=1 Tax=Cafeteria roenbergensis TaxID=33653 RepID=A0A5A8BY64_CAFRO|nr:hypothetical protein FNF29_08455 [Cafeteria roenbergensis]|eukprot:KAA0145626.1 hypothetical protein FNF29_08455 [Cafeteria roenbergensis]
MGRALLLATAAVLLAQGVRGWKEWTWEGDGPGPRAGHSMVLINETAFLFGGRANDIAVPHVPKTYEVSEENGQLSFTTYDQNLVLACDGNRTFDECYNISIGLLFNDLWSYDLDCTRFADDGCEYRGWTRVDPGARLGGCEFYAGELQCTHPTERYDQTLLAMDDGRITLFGGFSRKCRDYCSDQWEMDARGCLEARRAGQEAADATACRWQELGELGLEGPSQRWRHAAASNGTTAFVFGGHRLWHGFSPENSESNDWRLQDTRQYGGYLDDLWTYTPHPQLGMRGNWSQVVPRESCYHRRGVKHVARFDIRCRVIWPPRRASASLVATMGRDIGADPLAAPPEPTLLLFGGYSTPFPYPHRKARGAGSSTSRAAADGMAPFPTAPYYLDDLWRFNVSSGLWAPVDPLGGSRPSARRDSAMRMASDSAFLLFGGYGSNTLMNDLWIFNLTTTRWIHVGPSVHARFPQNCTDDTLRLPDGSDFVVSQSVFGEPTRFSALDGQAGRASEPVIIRQPRRQAPGWDGCRDRADGRPDLPSLLQYERPSQRERPASVLSLRRGEMLVHGGRAALKEDLPTVQVTHPAEVVGDMWLWRQGNCAKNCSGRGDCVFGHCYCYDGYYGLDCSNTSCPGDYCYMDETAHTQVCTHCCSARWEHADNQSYARRERKVPCGPANAGESHGICDGFGSCQCRPPFLTEDCSVRDCPDGCNGNGYCSVEFPVSRCVCDPGWTGRACDTRLCLNNCTYPNGVCVGGRCNCTFLQNPYNRSMVWARYEGDDCSRGTATGPNSALG